MNTYPITISFQKIIYIYIITRNKTLDNPSNKIPDIQTLTKKTILLHEVMVIRSACHYKHGLLTILTNCICVSMTCEGNYYYLICTRQQKNKTQYNKNTKTVS